MSQIELTLADDDQPARGWTIEPASLPMGARWRVVRHGGHEVGFILMQSRRRTIGFVVGDEGLRVTAPGWVPLRQVDAAVVEKMPWILGKLKDFQARRERLAMSHTRWQPGGELPYLGCRIVLRSGVPGPHVPHGSPHFEGDPAAPASGQALWLPLPHDAEAARIRDMTQSWLQMRARAWFDMRLAHFVSQTGLPVRRWRISSAATRWGSCNSDGSIMLNWRLIHFSPMVIDYVIAHELALLREMNHSSDFWAEVQQLYPDYKEARKLLQRHTPDAIPEL